MRSGLKGAVLSVIIGCALGCGSSSNDASSQAAGKDVMAAHNLHAEGQPTTTTVTLPQQLTDPNWGPKESLCQQAGYDLAPFAGQNMTLVKYTIAEKYYGPGTAPTGEALYLWVVAKDQTSVCGYLTVREGSNLIPGIMPVNDSSVR